MQDTTKSLLATSIAHFVNDGSTYVFITLYPRLLPLASEIFLIGVLAALQNLFSVMASPFIGRMADARKNFGTLIGLGISLMSIGVAGYAISPLFASGRSLFVLLLPFSIIAGIGSSFYHPLGGSVLGEKWRADIIGRAMGINGSSGSAGRAIYPLAVVTLAVYFTIPSVTALAIVGFLAALIVVIMLRSIVFSKPIVANKQDSMENDSRKGSRISFFHIIPLILPLTILSFLRGIFSIGIVNFVPVYLERVSGFKYLEAGLVFSLILVMPIFGQLFFGNFADRFGRRLALGVSTVGSGIAILILVGSTSPVVDVASFAVYGFFVFTGFPLLLPLAIGAVPKEAATLSNSIVWGIGNVGGGALGPFLIGLLAEGSYLGSLSSAFLVVAIIFLGSTALLPLIPKPQSR